MNSVTWVLLAACLVTKVSAQDNTTLGVGENKCQEELAACTGEYGDDDRNEKKLQSYHDCAEKVTCLKHEDGYNDRLQILSDIEDKLESLNADQGNWWDNGASSLEQAVFVKLICLVAACKIFFANV